MDTEEKAPIVESKALTESETIEKYKASPEFAAILNQHGKTYHELKAEESGASFIGKGLKMVDDALMEELGLKDRPKGKTTELIRQLARDKKELESKLAGIKPAEDTANQDAEKEQLYMSQLSAKDKQIQELLEKNEGLTKQGKQQKATSNLVNGLLGATYDPNYSSSVLDEIKAGRIKNAVNNSKEIDGKIIYYLDDGTPYTNLNGLPMSAKEVGQVLFKDIFHTKTAGGNAGKEDKPHVKGDIVVIPNPENIKSFTEFNNEFARAMRAKGLTRKDDEYYKLQKATSEHYKFKGLPSE